MGAFTPSIVHIVLYCEPVLWVESECIVYSIPRDTSGVLLLTRHQDAARRLAELFKERKIVKKYW